MPSSTKVKTLFQSRRFWAAVSGVVVILISSLFGIDETKLQAIAGIVISWIVGDSLSKTGSIHSLLILPMLFCGSAFAQQSAATLDSGSAAKQVLILQTVSGQTEFFGREWSGSQWGDWIQEFRQSHGSGFLVEYSRVPSSDREILNTIASEFPSKPGWSNTINLTGDDRHGARFRYGF